MIIRVRFTSLFVYWDHLYITDLKINLCQGENTPFVETHARIDYGFCQDSWAGDLSVLSFVMTFTTMLSVISCVFCYLSPRFFTGNIGSYTSFYFSLCLLLSLICQSLFPLTLIFCKSKFPETLGFTFKLLAISFQTFFGQSNFSSGTTSTFYIGMLVCLVLISLLMFYLYHLLIQDCFSLLKWHSHTIWEKNYARY